MSCTAKDILQDARVAITKLPEPVYSEASARAAITRAATELGWAEDRRGSFAGAIPAGARVLIKPNFVMHENQGPWGIEPLITHPSIIRAPVMLSLQAGASQVIVGDAPVQGCDFDRLLSATGLDEWAADLTEREPRFKGIFDFRRTTCVFVDGVRIASENLRDEDRFALFDLGRESLLEPITDSKASFRVTCYDPRLMSRTHASGRHQYLVAKEVLEADVIINLPKLKTHKKAGVTCALKNLIGINGNKEFLPHHRVGGSASGGDCYPGTSIVKRALEYSLDRQNQTTSFVAGRFWREVAVNLDRISIRSGDELGVEGSWSGNDTVWRTGLDLNRILLYGQTRATLADVPQRRVFHIADAVVAGQGDGPLRPEPLPLGLLFMGMNAAAVDWVGARLLGYDPSRISIVREAFADFRWPITSYTPDEVTLLGDFGAGNADQILTSRETPAIIYPAGWREAARPAQDDRRSI
jgi:uncharacterized protein (DUF362 family)